MRAVTVQMPWAFALAYNFKPVENRGRCDPWRSAVGQPVGIHAGLTWDDGALYDPRIWRTLQEAFDAPPMSSHVQWHSWLTSTALPQLHELDGKLLAARRLLDVHPWTDCRNDPDGRCSPWAEVDQWHLVFEAPVEYFQPTPLRGYQGLWTVPLDVAEIPRITPAGAR